MIGSDDVKRLLRELETFRKSINNLAEIMKHNNKLLIEHGRILQDAKILLRTDYQRIEQTGHRCLTDECEICGVGFPLSDQDIRNRLVSNQIDKTEKDLHG